MCSQLATSVVRFDALWSRCVSHCSRAVRVLLACSSRTVLVCFRLFYDCGDDAPEELGLFDLTHSLTHSHSLTHAHAHAHNHSPTTSLSLTLWSSLVSHCSRAVRVLFACCSRVVPVMFWLSRKKAKKVVRPWSNQNINLSEHQQSCHVYHSVSSLNILRAIRDKKRKIR